ncbi:rhodanese-like domain-containing protein [Macrococcus armenti]|uniref:Rhodanese-like domain-containing protein n=1 Tax=Macrococcus armenti TaxID=2875764 RepID=A0ABY3ZWU8_9STAP|nr:rhodanese-like domain-containing protein [Macrococcus armenti]UOB21370.1 rhodanese-like domain-containing protein [Macrococcus armenti]
MKHITIDALQDTLQTGTDAHIIDVRTPEEFAEGHIKSAINIPLNTIPNQLSQFNSEDEYIILCKRGGRALQAAEYLYKEGINITVVDQGMDDWKGEITK